MTRIIGVLNYKGGTGKTTTVVNLAAGLALRGSRVLCVDLDAQGGLATYLGVRHGQSMAHLLLGQADPHECIVEARENIDLIASDSSLLQAEGQLWRNHGGNGAAKHVLAERLQGVNGYDYVILDNSPSPSLLGESALHYAHQLIVPISMTYMALVGSRQVLQALKKIARSTDHRIQLSLVVPTFFNAWLRKDRQVMQVLQRHFADVLAEPIRTNVSLAEAPGHQMSIFEYAPRSAGAADYANLVERVAMNGR